MARKSINLILKRKLYLQVLKSIIMLARNTSWYLERLVTLVFRLNVLEVWISSTQHKSQTFNNAEQKQC